MAVSHVDSTGAVSPEWREHYAALAAAWVKERGTMPASVEELAEWAAQEGPADLEAELAYLEGRGPDPCSTSS